MKKTCIHTVSEALNNKMVYAPMATDQNQWDWDLMNDIFEEKVINLILSTPIQHNAIDLWYCCKEKMKNYTIKSTYLLIQKSKVGQHSSDNSVF